jgi:hypothetical protein
MRPDRFDNQRCQPCRNRSEPYGSSYRIIFNPPAEHGIFDEDMVREEHCPAENQPCRTCYEREESDEIQGVPWMKGRR